MADETAPLALHDLRPAPGSRRERKRIGRGHGSGAGKTAGRGQKGQKSRSGSHRLRAGFEGGQMPLYMRLGKLRGPNHRKSMPMGPFRTRTTPVNLRDLERFDAGVEVTPELLKTAGVVRSLAHPVKILATGELTKKLTVTAHAFSKRAAEAIEAAGGTVVVIGGAEKAEEKPKRPRRTPAAAAAEPAETETETEAAPAEEAAAEPEAEAAPEPDADEAQSEEE